MYLNFHDDKAKKGGKEWSVKMLYNHNCYDFCG